MRIALALGFYTFFLFQCAENTSKNDFQHKTTFAALAKRESPTKTLSRNKQCDSLVSFQTLTIAGHQVDIALPKGKVKGNLLVLQGFAFPKDDWCKKSSLCKKALAQGYALIMPEMGKSNYMSKFYPQTRPDWQKYPQKYWLTDSVFNFLQKKYCMLLPEQKNFIVGLSTGARGVAIVALEKNTLFKAVAALSGDYDQTKIPNDNVHIGYYGAYRLFSKRWKEEDNPIFEIKKWQTPIYIGHGKLDNVCPHQQSLLFYEALQKNHPHLDVKLHIDPKHTHNYKYWDAEVDNILDFFAKYLEE
ncbi:MAG: prolyl oligopeptidase family serine peptidase [Thermonemataceae bacterium]|nr:prolyl oligopeptidase family serine peptidase [Thermonemataceae bacterium]